jgi:hypothetical protein
MEQPSSVGADLSGRVKQVRKRRKLLVAGPVLALALAAGGTAWADNANSGWNEPHNGAHGYGPRGSLHWGFGRASAPFGIVAAALASNVLTVTEFNGAQVTYHVTLRTRYFLNGSAASVGSVVAGENVVVVAGHNWGGWSGGSSTTTPIAQTVYLFSPHVFGAVQSTTTNSTGTLIVVQDPQGFWHSIQTGASTVYYLNGQALSAPPTLNPGQIIAALGSIAPDHVTLDATQVALDTRHHRWNGDDDNGQ